MSQNYQLGLLGQYITVNTSSNTANLSVTFLSGSNNYSNGTAITGGSSSNTTLDGFFIDCGIYS
jgi:hypothetical protein